LPNVDLFFTAYTEGVKEAVTMNLFELEYEINRRKEIIAVDEVDFLPNHTRLLKDRKQRLLYKLFRIDIGI